ncbi:MAG: phosphatase PAP2 family protein [Reyranella sp.]|uniref:phosphatase PAP2 family protein n=1 Tax=Reyranella sp. TaxID=1929291 RepID=UPI001ACA656F|nr:phosphatase PAP2 family protein [Reyranella sp.]MBN9088030.1 phosphatase PAP2 family protein [Reyranella sp.]
MWWLHSLDEALVLWINAPAGRSAALDRFVYDIADSPLLKGGLFLSFYWWLWFDRAPGRRREIAAALTAAVVVALLSRAVQVGLPFHQRPLHTPGFGVHLPLGVTPETLNTFSSFPSDHAMLFFALCVPIWRYSRPLGLAAMLWTTLVICLPRIYLAYHYPSDIVGGAVAGVGLMLLLEPPLLRSGLPDRIAKLAEGRPALFYASAFAISFELAVLFADARHFAVDAAQLGKQMFTSY